MLGITTRNLSCVPIKAVAQRLGLRPMTVTEKYAMYKAPWRDESTASLKIDYEKNLFYDFGDSSFNGNTVILIQQVLGINIEDALDWLDENFPEQGNSSQVVDVPYNEVVRNKIIEVLPVDMAYCEDTLAIHKISYDVASRYCSMVHYRNYDGVEKYGVGLQTINGGYIVLSQRVILCAGRNGITIIGSADNEECVLFGGMLDFLAYVELYGEPQKNVVIMNNDHFVNEAAQAVSSFTSVECYLHENSQTKKLLTNLRMFSTAIIDNHNYTGHNSLFKQYKSSKKEKSK